jgi:hypothetical protein
MRSSPRRSVPSTKAQEAAEDHVQSGRVTKKSSPSKAKTSARKATSVKKASPAKATKTATPAKKATSAKSSPATAKKAGTPKKASKSQAQALDNDAADAQALPDNGYAISDFAWYVSSESHNIIEKLESFPSIAPVELALCYGRLLETKAELDGNARKTDSEKMRELRPIYRKLKKLLRNLVGDGVDECLKNGIGRVAFSKAISVGLGRAGIASKGVDVPRDSFPMIRMEDAVGPKPRTIPADFEQELRETDELLQELRKERAERVAAGRVTKPASRAASRSKSPAKSPAKRERTSSMSRPVRSRSQSPAKAPARRVSKSPAPIEARRTRSMSPSKTVDALPTEVNEKRSRSKSPAKAPARRGSKSPAPIVNPKTRSKSPAKAAIAQTTSASRRKSNDSPAPIEVAKTRSRSPAKADTSKSAYTVDQDESSGKKKSPAKRAASVSGRSPSPAKRSRAASPAKETPAPTSARARSKSPIKKASPQKSSATARPYNRPHPSHSDRGIIISPTNPQMIESLGKPNPFHETLPAPETWHRRMPPNFPFGETPYMEREISRQIDEDLNRGK